MSKNVTESVCVVCDHEIVQGVACDWRPEDCPYSYDAKKHSRRFTQQNAMWASLLGETSEYDAVRSDT